jgi:hypothetical protein
VLQLSAPQFIDWLELMSPETASLGWLERAARQLLTLPDSVIGATRRDELRRRLERRDWMPADWVLIREDLQKYSAFLE